MLNSFWGLARSWPIAGRLRPALIASMILACGLTACAVSSTSTSTGTPSATTISTPIAGSATATSAPETGTATTGTAFTCNAVDPLIQILQSNSDHVDFSISALPNVAIKGSIVTYSVNSQFKMSGMGYLVTPNDPVQLQIVKGSNFVHIMVKDMTTGKVTTYVADSCLTRNSTDIAVSGTIPYNFTLDLLVTP